MPTTGSLEKLVVDLPENDQGAAELLWALSLGEGVFKLQNVPIWAYGLAFDDIVEAVLQNDERFHYTRIRHRSGLLTVRIAGPEAPRSEFEELTNSLAARAVAAEHFSDVYVAFAIAADDYNACFRSSKTPKRPALFSLKLLTMKRSVRPSKSDVFCLYIG
ncbi:MAG TPA: DUF4265 domain-containing protein [Candidatus Elarobacter sp.]|jgi:hypothetical protein